MSVTRLRCSYRAAEKHCCRLANEYANFHPTVLTVALMLQCCVCRLSVVVCDVMYCG